MNFRTKNYLRRRFGDYYKNSKLVLPPEFAKREWGFIFFDEMPEVVMRRHKAFSSEGEALEYLRGMTPAHVYHSAAYYQYPGAGTMKEKQWQGADLVFDLDADHLPPDVRGKSYKEMLDAVKEETNKLLDFLIEDFGFSEDNVSIVFSGVSEKEIRIDIIPPLKPQNSIVEMKGKSFRIQEGINTLPEYAAVYLMCRGAAEYV